MKKLILQLRVAILLRQARRRYFRVAAIRDSYSCGGSLARFMSSRLTEAEARFRRSFTALKWHKRRLSRLSSG